MTDSLWPEEKPLSETQVGFVDTLEDVFEFKRWLSQKRDVLALDTETSGLDPYAPGARIRLFQCGDVNTGWAIDAVKWPGLMYEVLEKYEGQQVWHNVAFDAKWIKVLYPSLQFPWRKTHDTMIQHRIYDNEASAALKTISGKLWGQAAVSGQEALRITMENTKTDWDTVPLEAPAYKIYSAVDVILTARLHRHLTIVHSGEFKRSYQIEMQTRRICNQMELRGMQIDQEYCQTKSNEFEKFIEDAIAYADGKWGVKLGSTKELGKWFVDQGADILELTSTGQPKMDEDSLTHLINQGYELADLALKARKATKIKSTYLDNFLTFGATSNGIVHPQINTMAARTGRMSIQNPALQTLPRDDKTVRPSIIPHEGDVLLSCDLDQVEFRYISHLSEDEGLIEMFRTADSPGGLDVFTQIGRDVFEDPEMVKKDPRRAVIKTMLYARAYGAGIAKQALSAGIPQERMKNISDTFDQAYPGMAKYTSKLVGEMNEMVRAGERPYVTTFTGRRLYVPKDRVYVAGNYMVQGSCAEVFKLNVIDMSMSGLDDYMVCPVHDEILLSVPTSEAYDVTQVVSECMTTNDFSVPLPAGCSEPMTRWVKS